MDYYDDNYGHWGNEPDEDFYHHVQATNVEKECKGCGRIVMIQPQYAYCNSCAEIMERGGEFY